MSHRIRVALVGVALLAALGPWASSTLATDGPEVGHEVWLIDQSDTRPDGGGRLYVYDGNTLAGSGAASAVPQVIDLGGATRDLCLEETGTAPRRPHMILFNTAQTHGLISFVATGHVVFFDAATRQPVSCIDVGVQAHAAFPAPNDQYAIVANQNGKKLHRIATGYATDTFTLDPIALDLAVGTTPAGASREDPMLRPDNAPICPMIDASSRFTFTTLRGGGLLVVRTDVSPMQIVGEYDRTVIHPNGCGGLQVGDKMYINSGGTAANPHADLYVLPVSAFPADPSRPNTPAPTVVFSRHEHAADSHGASLAIDGRHLWVCDRAANTIDVVDTATDSVANVIDLAGPLSTDPSCDLGDIAPDGSRMYFSLRGPTPLSGDPHAASGTTPGVGVLEITDEGRNGRLVAIAPISNIIGGKEAADGHGLRVRRPQTAASAQGLHARHVPFTAATKVAAPGRYVTFRFDLGLAAAGKLVTIHAATKTAGAWSSFAPLTKRIANASGVVYYSVRQGSAAWKAYRADIFGVLTPARHARWR